MKSIKATAAALAALVTAASAASVFAYADDEASSSITVTPVYSKFNALDVNGSVIINLPESSSASVNIVFDSPEGSDWAYYEYTCSSSESSQYIFDMEGSDDRTYSLTMSAVDEETEHGSRNYTEELTFTDIDFYPDTRKDYVYNISIEQQNSDTPYIMETTTTDVTGGQVIETNITFYVAEVYLMGDVNNDGIIDAIDASLVLGYYAATATGSLGDFNESQKVASDVNGDNVIDAVDASEILAYYAYTATGGTDSPDVYFSK